MVELEAVSIVTTANNGKFKLGGEKLKKKMKKMWMAAAF
jgi:hypothetical protein